jgi:hypothetical protein
MYSVAGGRQPPAFDEIRDGSGALALEHGRSQAQPVSPAYKETPANPQIITWQIEGGGEGCEGSAHACARAYWKMSGPLHRLARQVCYTFCRLLDAF